MTTGERLRAAPFVLATATAVTVIVSAPFVGQLRSWIRQTFPGRFVLIVGVIGAALLLAAIVAAASRIRDRKLRRYGLIALSVAIAAGYSLATAAPNPETNAVERFHFLEYGLLTFLFYRAWRPLNDLSILLLPAMAGLITGTVEEWFQWFIPNRVGELRDIFLNLVAISCGLLFSLGVDPPPSFAPTLGRHTLPRVGRAVALAVLSIAAFVHVIHLGHNVADPVAGTFTSRYSPAALATLQSEKRQQWTVSPPPLVLRRLSREDQFLSEGLAHVRERNKRWDAGDIRAAWQENLILERYFQPVLDTPTYEGKAGHRWPAPHRADAEARLGGTVADAGYVSAAYPYRIYTWPKALFWLLTAALAVACLAVSRISTRARRA